jgi:thiol-disulfide isomerase/thioredoxin
MTLRIVDLPWATGLIALLAPLAFSGPSIADPLPGKVAIEDLELTRDWVVAVDGEEVSGAEIYYSDYEVAWLVSTPQLGSLLISPRGKSVQRVAGKALREKGGAAAELDASPELELVAEFTTSQRVMSFELDGHAVELRPAPPMMGRQAAKSVEERHPTFAQKEAAYQEKVAIRAAPVQKAAAEQLLVRVYFGSWSPICQRIVPKIMAVEKVWRSVRFEYYGLPEILIEDQLAKDQGITGVPTVVVLRGGEEVARLTGRQLDQPADVLENALNGL